MKGAAAWLYSQEMELRETKNVLEVIAAMPQIIDLLMGADL